MRPAPWVLLALSIVSGAAAQTKPALRLEIIGEQTPAIGDPAQTCDASDIPDAPARAIRLDDGTVQLYASDQVNRVDRGADLLHLRHDCTIVLQGAHRDDPAAYDDRAWIASPWTEDGRTIWAVIHNEFHGHARKWLCPTGRYMDCWFNALTLAVSTDLGRSFQRAPEPALVATLPYRFDELGLGHHGYFNPSNIVRFDGALYMFAFATRAKAQRAGNCLLRTQSIASADSWRAWDGAGFNVRFVNPYTGPDQPERHVCAPVDLPALRWPVTSLVQHRKTGSFIALMQDTGPGGGVLYATSPDLIHWSGPALLLSAVGLRAWACGDPDPIAYPSLLDDSSVDANFQGMDDTAELFATRFDKRSCQAGARRTLVRWPVGVVITPN